MRIIVAGSRNFDDYSIVVDTLIKFFNENKMLAPDIAKVEIVSGTARGADRLGERFAKEYGCELKQFPADWDKFGKPAGMIRNKEMALYASNDSNKDGILIAFWDGLSRGTKAMIDIANKTGLEVIVVRVDKLKNKITIEELKDKIALYSMGSYLFNPDGYEVHQYDILYKNKIIGVWYDNSDGCRMDKISFTGENDYINKEFQELIDDACKANIIKDAKKNNCVDEKTAYDLNLSRLLRKIREAGGVCETPDYIVDEEIDI